MHKLDARSLGRRITSSALLMASARSVVINGIGTSPSWMPLTPNSALSPQRSEALLVACVQTYGKAPPAEIGGGSAAAVPSTQNGNFLYHCTTIS